jgi:hypothetical protein
MFCLKSNNPKEYLINYANCGSNYHVGLLPSRQRLGNVVYSKGRVYTASNAGHTALSAQLMRNRAQAVGAGAILEMLWWRHLPYQPSIHQTAFQGSG